MSQVLYPPKNGPVCSMEDLVAQYIDWAPQIYNDISTTGFYMNPAQMQYCPTKEQINNSEKLSVTLYKDVDWGTEIDNSNIIVKFKKGKSYVFSGKDGQFPKLYTVDTMLNTSIYSSWYGIKSSMENNELVRLCDVSANYVKRNVYIRLHGFTYDSSLDNIHPYVSENLKYDPSNFSENSDYVTYPYIMEGETSFDFSIPKFEYINSSIQYKKYIDNNGDGKADSNPAVSAFSYSITNNGIDSSVLNLSPIEYTVYNNKPSTIYDSENTDSLYTVSDVTQQGVTVDVFSQKKNPINIYISTEGTVNISDIYNNGYNILKEPETYTIYTTLYDSEYINSIKFKLTNNNPDLYDYYTYILSVKNDSMSNSSVLVDSSISVIDSSSYITYDKLSYNDSSNNINHYTLWIGATEKYIGNNINIYSYANVLTNGLSVSNNDIQDIIKLTAVTELKDGNTYTEIIPIEKNPLDSNKLNYIYTTKKDASVNDTSIDFYITFNSDIIKDTSIIDFVYMKNSIYNVSTGSINSYFKENTINPSVMLRWNSTMDPNYNIYLGVNRRNLSTIYVSRNDKNLNVSDNSDPLNNYFNNAEEIKYTKKTFDSSLTFYFSKDSTDTTSNQITLNWFRNGTEYDNKNLPAIDQSYTVTNLNGGEYQLDLNLHKEFYPKDINIHIDDYKNTSTLYYNYPFNSSIALLINRNGYSFSGKNLKCISSDNESGNFSYEQLKDSSYIAVGYKLTESQTNMIRKYSSTTNITFINGDTSIMKNDVYTESKSSTISYLMGNIIYPKAVRYDISLFAEKTSTFRFDVSVSESVKNEIENGYLNNIQKAEYLPSGLLNLNNYSVIIDNGIYHYSSTTSYNSPTEQSIKLNFNSTVTGMSSFSYSLYKVLDNSLIASQTEIYNSSIVKIQNGYFSDSPEGIIMNIENINIDTIPIYAMMTGIDEIERPAFIITDGSNTVDFSDSGTYTGTNIDNINCGYSEFKLNAQNQITYWTISCTPQSYLSYTYKYYNISVYATTDLNSSITDFNTAWTEIASNNICNFDSKLQYSFDSTKGYKKYLIKFYDIRVNTDFLGFNFETDPLNIPTSKNMCFHIYFTYNTMNGPEYGNPVISINNLTQFNSVYMIDSISVKSLVYDSANKKYNATIEIIDDEIFKLIFINDKTNYQIDDVIWANSDVYKNTITMSLIANYTEFNYVNYTNNTIDSNTGIDTLNIFSKYSDILKSGEIASYEVNALYGSKYYDISTNYIYGTPHTYTRYISNGDFEITDIHDNIVDIKILKDITNTDTKSDKIISYSPAFITEWFDKALSGFINIHFPARKVERYATSKYNIPLENIPSGTKYIVSNYSYYNGTTEYSAYQYTHYTDNIITIEYKVTIDNLYTEYSKDIKIYNFDILEWHGGSWGITLKNNLEYIYGITLYFKDIKNNYNFSITLTDDPQKL